MNANLNSLFTEIELAQTPWKIKGVSEFDTKMTGRCGFIIEGLGIKFDCGVQFEKPGPTFLTCTKYGNVRELPSTYLVPIEESSTEKQIVILPEKIADSVKNFVVGAMMMTKSTRDPSTLKISFDFTMTNDTDCINMKIKNIRFKIEPLQNGYGFTEIRTKLNDEYKGLTQHELSELKKKGVDICHDKEIPSFCYVSNISNEIFSLEKSKIKKYINVVLSCPFLFPEDKEKAAELGCLHWSDIEHFIASNSSTKFIVCGFSVSYDYKTLTDFFSAIGFANVIPHVNMHHPNLHMMNAHMFKEVTVPQTLYKLKGSSEAARRTGFLMEIKKNVAVKLDCGVEIGETTENVPIFVTHSHYDHVRELPSAGLKMKMQGKKQTVVIPQKIINSVKNYVKATYAMVDPTLNVNDMFDFVSMNDTDPIYIKLGDTNFKIEPFKCTHSTSCLGYGFIEIRDGEEIPIFCYIGDTDHRVLVTEKAKLEKYIIIIIECTFIFPEDKKKAKKDKHMYVEYLNVFAESHPLTTLILYHFSLRYNYKTITEFFASQKIVNLIPFVNKFLHEGNVQDVCCEHEDQEDHEEDEKDEGDNEGNLVQ